MGVLDQVPGIIRSNLERAAVLVRKFQHVTLFSHYDADGISALTINRIALERAGIAVDYHVFPTLGDEQLEEIRGCGYECMVMSDMGTYMIPELIAINPDCVILDHHKYPADFDPVAAEKIPFANPYQCGLSSNDACGATMSFLFAVALDEGNMDLCQYALTGLIGDNQHQGGLTGLNGIVVQEGIKAGYIVAARSLFPLGRLYYSLMNNIDPYVRGVSCNPVNIMRLLDDLGLSSEYVYRGDRDSSEVCDKVGKLMVSAGVCTDVVKTASVDHYLLKDFNQDAQTVSDVLDACGRTGHEDLALSVVDTLDLSIGAEVYRTFRANVCGLMLYAEENLRSKEYFHYLLHECKSAGGIVAAAAVRYLTDSTKPVIAINPMEDKMNVSSRCSPKILVSGIDLSRAVGTAARACGGNGGGHPHMAGGEFEKGRTEEFLEILDEVLGEQLAH